MCEVWASISRAGKSEGSGDPESVKGNHQDKGNGGETWWKSSGNTLMPVTTTQNKGNDGRAKAALVGKAAVLHSAGRGLWEAASFL